MGTELTFVLDRHSPDLQLSKQKGLVKSLAPPQGSRFRGIVTRVDGSAVEPGSWSPGGTQGLCPISKSCDSSPKSIIWGRTLNIAARKALECLSRFGLDEIYAHFMEQTGRHKILFHSSHTIRGRSKGIPTCLSCVPFEEYKGTRGVVRCS